MKFHDGSPLTADDVVYTFRRLLDPKTASPAASELGAIKPEAFKAVDPNTVKVTLIADGGAALDPGHQAWHGGQERRLVRRYPLPSQWHRARSR